MILKEWNTEEPEAQLEILIRMSPKLLSRRLAAHWLCSLTSALCMW